MEVLLYRFGDHFDLGVLGLLIPPVHSVFRVPVSLVEQPIALPEDAHYPVREQWLARKLTEALAATPLPEQQAAGSVVGAGAPQLAARQQLPLRLGVTDYDIFSTGYHQVLSHTLPEQRCAVISVARLDDRFYGAPDLDVPAFRRRCAATAVHELGRLMGLPHCKTAGCVMVRSETVREIDAKGWRMCDGCRALLANPLPPRPPAPVSRAALPSG